ncbi:MAG TPA: Ppx/GppA family phosphatase [Candidatus Barnesiella excrementipullorum]|uniref:Ppx/GppA family phosphatase n=1 Tax=Candidatus Barnesiella excrementipullorum TaxID=2838479 RepID=A0A9D1VQE3_9BACT|nr:Ppx/GppA family phosphatase [Candidatus Barnesiella excrementipullorum]
MGKCVYAAIDIGSNAARLLIKSVDDSQEKCFKKEMLLRVPLRLGFDVFAKGELSEKKAGKLKRLMKAFRQLMKIYDVDRYRACATSAMRDARNGSEVIREIKKSTGIAIEIIDGEEEARMVYNNHIECLEDRKGNYLYVDVGGGSTEVNLLTEGELVYSKSYNIGTVRILSDAVESGAWEKMESDLAAVTQPMQQVNIIGSGGNINKLFKLAPLAEADKEMKRLPVESLRALYSRLQPLSVAERMDTYNLKQDRADVIVPAAEIFLRIADTIGAEFISVPVIGLSDGIIDDMYARDRLDEDKKTKE